tara:strand:- start:187 stop:351 length:165 start_codon:yes stop_codon:yes gene_type:complete
MQASKIKEIVRYIKYGHDTWLLPHWEDFDGDMDDEIESLEGGYEDWISKEVKRD